MEHTELMHHMERTYLDGLTDTIPVYTPEYTATASRKMAEKC